MNNFLNSIKAQKPNPSQAQFEMQTQQIRDAWERVQDAQGRVDDVVLGQLPKIQDFAKKFE